MSQGYSGTPIPKKLGFKDSTILVVIEQPEGYESLVGPFPAGLEFANKLTKETNFVHLFATKKSLLTKHLKALRSKLPDDAVVWVSWPKKTSKVETDITEDIIRDVALPMGFVDIKVCAINAVWSGLKLMVRKELRRKE
ncbi:MAG: hypothetical protein U0930_15570 [Pirellulales bacterium]